MIAAKKNCSCVSVLQSLYHRAILVNLLIMDKLSGCLMLPSGQKCSVRHQDGSSPSSWIPPSPWQETPRKAASPLAAPGTVHNSLWSALS